MEVRKTKSELEKYPEWQLAAYLGSVLKGNMPQEGESVTMFLRRMAPQYPEQFSRLPFDVSRIVVLPWRFPLLVGTLRAVRNGSAFANHLDEYGEQPLLVSADHQAGKESFYFLQALDEVLG